MRKRLFQLYIVTPAVFCSVVIGGGYGTGREVVEYFSSQGPVGGLLAISAAWVGFFVVLFLTFELARRYDAHDYRTFFSHVLGRFWWLYEGLYLLLFVLVIGVIGAAVQQLASEQLGLPGRWAMLLLFLAVVGITLWGRLVIERFLTGWAFLMFVVFFAYLVILGVDWSQITLSTQVPAASDWAASGLLYAGYNVAVLPVLLFTVRGLQNAKESMISGLLTAFAICLPAVLFHLSYLRGLPEVLTAALPNYWMIRSFGPALLLSSFTLALAGTLVETASGLVQGFIERIEHSRSQPLATRAKLGIIVLLLACGGLAGQFGVITLIASGYSAMAVGFILIYVIPIIIRFMTDWRFGSRRP